MLKGNYDINTELEEIERRGISFGAEIRRTVTSPFVSEAKRKFGIDDLIEKVPNMFAALYGEEKAKQEWRKIAKLVFSAASSLDLEPDVLATLRDIMDMYEKQLRTMRKRRK